MGDKDYPTNISRFFRPEIPPDQETIKDYELPPTPPPRTTKEGELSEGDEIRRRKKKILKKKEKKQVDHSELGPATIVHVTSPVALNDAIVQNNIPMKVSPVTPATYNPDIAKDSGISKRGRKKKAQNVTIVQVNNEQTTLSPTGPQLASPINITPKDSKTIRPTLVHAYGSSHLPGSGVVVSQPNAIIVHAENVKVEMETSQTQQNLLSVGAAPVMSTAATVIPIQHTNQIFHQIQVQQQQSQLHTTQQVVQQQPHIGGAPPQPITEHVWVSGHQVFYNTR